MDHKKIVVLACENSALKAAAQAGGASGADDADIRDLVEIVPLPCSGKAEIALMLQTLERGYPGVLVLGCPRDNCKYLKGNLRAEKRVEQVRKILRDIGIEEDRVRMDYISSVDAHRFTEAVRRMHEGITALQGGVS